MPKSSTTKQRFAAGSSRATRSRHTLLLQMAKDAERLAAQAQRIGELRAARRVTQPEVADAVNVTLRAYQAWEAGDSDPKGPNIKALAEYFGTSPDYIEFGVERQPTPDPDLTQTPPDLLERIADIQSRLERLENVEQAVNEIRELLLAAEVVRLDAANKPRTAPRSRPARPTRAA